MKVKMRANRVLIRQAAEEGTVGGIVLTHDGKEPDIFDVIAFGDDVQGLEIGDKVLVNILTVKSIFLQGKEFGLCMDEAIYAVVGEGTEIPAEKKPSALSSLTFPSPSGIIY